MLLRGNSMLYRFVTGIFQKIGFQGCFHRQLIVGGLASEYENELRAWLDELE